MGKMIEYWLSISGRDLIHFVKWSNQFRENSLLENLQSVYLLFCWLPCSEMIEISAQLHLFD